MKAVSFYHKETGRLHGNLLIVSDDEVLALNTPADHAAIEGHHDPLSKRFDIETKRIVEWIPDAPSADHVWNPETKRWQPSAAAAEKIARGHAARARIQELEASQHRHLRGQALGKPGAAEALQAIDDEISALELQL